MGVGTERSLRCSTKNVDASFKAYLEELVDLGRACTLRFRDAMGGVAELRVRLLSLEEESGRWVLETDAGMSVGVEQLVSVNGRDAALYC